MLVYGCLGSVLSVFDMFWYPVLFVCNIFSCFVTEFAVILASSLTEFNEPL